MHFPELHETKVDETETRPIPAYGPYLETETYHTPVFRDRKAEMADDTIFLWPKFGDQDVTKTSSGQNFETGARLLITFLGRFETYMSRVSSKPDTI